MEAVRVCLVGSGRVGHLYSSIYQKYITEAKIVAVVDTDILRTREVASECNIPDENIFDNFEQAIEKVKIDTALITTPTFTHAKLTVLAAESGLHVFCEKPMAVDLQDCDLMIRACNKAGVLFQIGFMRRFDPGFMGAKKHIDDGIIGEPIMIKSVGRGPGLPPKWTYDISKSNGMLAEVNSHDFDTIRWLGNGEYKRIYAEAQNFKCPVIGEEFPEFYDTAAVSARLDNDVIGIIDGVCPCDYGYDARAEVVGTKGVIFIGSLSDHSFIWCTRGAGLVSPQTISWKTRFNEAYINEHKHFIECITKGTDPDVKGEDGKMATAAAVAANKSIVKNMPVYL